MHDVLRRWSRTWETIQAWSVRVLRYDLRGYSWEKYKDAEVLFKELLVQEVWFQGLLMHEVWGYCENNRIQIQIQMQFKFNYMKEINIEIDGSHTYMIFFFENGLGFGKMIC